MTLTASEYNILNKIATKTKMDCWFWLFQGKDGEDKVKDHEKGRTISLRSGVSQLNEGIVSYDLCGMNVEEIMDFENLLRKLNIPVLKERHIDHIIDCCERLLTISDEMEYEGIDHLVHEIKATAEIVKGDD